MALVGGTMTLRHHAEMDLPFERHPEFAEIAARDLGLWHPDATLVIPADGHNGLALVAVPPRGILHITVSSGYSPSTASYFGNPYWPHMTITSERIYQHLPLDVGGYALAHEYGPETNRANCVQFEVVWQDAADANMPDALIRNLVSAMKFASEARGIPYTFSEMYRPGVILASTFSPIRFYDDEWINRRGRCMGWNAHSNVPSGNDHWDANFDIARISALLGADPPSQEDNDMAVRYALPDGRVFVTDGLHRRYVGTPMENDVLNDIGVKLAVPDPAHLAAFHAGLRDLADADAATVFVGQALPAILNAVRAIPAGQPVDVTAIVAGVLAGIALKVDAAGIGDAVAASLAARLAS